MTPTHPGSQHTPVPKSHRLKRGGRGNNKCELEKNDAFSRVFVEEEFASVPVSPGVLAFFAQWLLFFPPKHCEMEKQRIHPAHYIAINTFGPGFMTSRKRGNRRGMLLLFSQQMGEERTGRKADLAVASFFNFVSYFIMTRYSKEKEGSNSA